MSQSYSGLDTACPNIWTYLENVQHYHGGSTIWLHYFNRLNNENKHDSLVPQIKTTRERVYVNIQGGRHVNWDPSAVKFSQHAGQRVYIGGVPVDPSTQMPIPDPSQEVKRIIWVDFHFKDIPVSAIELLKLSIDGVERITSDVRKWL